MIRLLIDEVFLEHIDLLVSQHATFSYFAEKFNLRSECLIFIYFLHEASVLLRFSWIYGLWPAALSVVHTLVSSTDTFCVDLVN